MCHTVTKTRKSGARKPGARKAGAEKSGASCRRNVENSRSSSTFILEVAVATFIQKRAALCIRERAAPKGGQDQSENGKKNT